MTGNPWTPWQLYWLEILYPDYSAEDLVKYLGHPIKSIHTKASSMKLRKSASFLSANTRILLNGKRGVSSQFKKGQEAWNKGIKSNLAPGAGFQPGNKPVNSKPIGTLVKNRCGRFRIKIAMHPAKWEMAHIHAWVQAGNPLPVHPEVFKFKDGNKENWALENLEISTKQKIMEENNLKNLPENLQEIIRLKGRIVRKINGKQQ